MTTYDVYGLIDPSDHQVFYVGCSKAFRNRLQGHLYDSASSAWHRCQKIIKRGDKVGHCLFARGLPREDARILEARLTLSIPSLTNSKASHILPLSDDFERPWLDLSSEIRPRKRWDFTRAPECQKQETP